MQEVRAAVIGTGVMGRKYAQMIAEGKAGALRLTAVVCRSAGAQQWAKDTLPDTVRVCPSADQLYDYAEEFDAVLLSRAQLAAPAQCAAAAAHLERALEAAKSSCRFAPGEILAKDWDALTDADLAALAACGYRQASCEKLHFDQHAAFTSLCFLELHLTPQQLQAAAQRLFAAPECGQVLRVKGFAPAPAGGWLELNATAAGCTLAPIPQGQEVVIVIGEGLDKTAIEAKLKG